MEAFFQLTKKFRGSDLNPRFYRSTTKLLAAIEGNWISPKTADSTYEVKLFTDHEAWDKDFSQADLTKLIDEAVKSFNAISPLQYASDGVTVIGPHPDYQRLCKEWRKRSLPKLQAIFIEAD